MNKFIFILYLFPFMQKSMAQDPITMVIQQGIKKVIIAVDLKIQRLQTKTIWLQNVQKLIENEMSKLKLQEISGWVQQQKDLYQNYFDELWKVKDVITYYHRIHEITQNQLALVRAYHIGWKGAQQDGHFNAGEIQYIGRVYTGIMEESLKNLDKLSLVIHSFVTQMGDAKRLEIINSAADAIQKNYSDLKQFNEQNIKLSLQRSKDEHEVAVVKSLYGIH